MNGRFLGPRFPADKPPSTTREYRIHIFPRQSSSASYKSGLSRRKPRVRVLSVQPEISRGLAAKLTPPFFQPRQTDSELSLQCDIPAALFALHQKEQTVVITGLCNLLLDFLHRFHRMAIHL